MVVGSQGQAVLNPLYSAMLKIDAEIRQMEDRIGLSPKARVSLGIQIGQMKKSLDDLNSELEEECNQIQDLLTLNQAELESNLLRLLDMNNMN